MIEFLVIAVTAGICLFLWKSRWNYVRLPTLPLQSNAQLPNLTVIIPARNEAHQITRAVASFPNIQVIVVDDDSTDNTAAIAAEAGAQVITAPPLQPDHKGKPNACAEGARHATTKWILFIDADTWFDPPFAASLVAYAESQRLAFVTAFLEQHCETLTEKILLPYAFALYFTGVSARAVNNAKSRESLANGQCMLFERAVYESIGGHSAVAQSVIEDVALACHAKQAGVAVRVIRAESSGHVRMYDSLAAIWRGFEKNSFRFLLINPGAGLQVILASILLTSWLPLLLLGLSDYPALSPAMFFSFTPLLLLFVAPFIVFLPWYRKATVLFAPIAIYLFQLIALNAMFTTLNRRRTLWKDRHV